MIDESRFSEHDTPGEGKEHKTSSIDTAGTHRGSQTRASVEGRAT